MACFVLFVQGNISTKGSFTRAVSVPMAITANVYHCANGDGPFDRQIWFGAHSVCQCKFDGDCEGDGTCKPTLMPLSVALHEYNGSYNN